QIETMSLVQKICGSASNLLFNPSRQVFKSAFGENVLNKLTSCEQQQVRTRWPDWKMIRDNKRRKLVVEYYPRRVRLNCIRKNTILPTELKEIADKEMKDLPKRSANTMLTNRCAVTSRARGRVKRWNVSRLVFRHLADYNYLSGVIRAKW
ncbi:unnamed protein product, partial [Owenia fusiformis]